MGHSALVGTVSRAHHAETESDSPMKPSQSAQRPNMDLVVRAGSLISTGFAKREEDLFADDFVFHYFNSQLPELTGDHHGLAGIASFFERVGEASDSGFHNKPHSLTPYGDELVVAYATNTVSFGGTVLDVDAIVVWRVFGGRIREAWDIPAVNTVRPQQPGEG